jgi:formate dehydrogenase subunit gamma
MTLHLCRAENCTLKGGLALAAFMQTTYGIGWNETTRDGSMTLRPVYCLGMCKAAPCASSDGQTFVKLTPAKLKTTVERLGGPKPVPVVRSTLPHDDPPASI